MDRHIPLNRRDLLKYSATGLAAASAAWTGAPTARAAGKVPTSKADQAPPSDRLVVGFIGTGNLGLRYHMRHVCLGGHPFSKHVDIAAVCDVDTNHVNEAAQACMDARGKRVAVYKDYRKLLDRKDLDGVFIVTPDHWHAIIATAAMEAGLDVYCEKPLTLTVDEGKSLVRTARRYGTVFQTGSQQRSGAQFRQACELVRNGKIGKIKRVDTVLHPVGAGSWKPVQTPPANLNWNMWLGPAPYVDYCPNRVHYQFRWFFDYSGGVMTDWGAHHNDICQWALGMDGSGPVYVDGTKSTFSETGPYTVAQSFDVHYRYANGVDLYCHTHHQKYDDGTEFGNGIKFTGENGWIFVDRTKILASDPELLKTEFGPDDERLYESPDHHLNWFECVKKREKPICDVEVGHRSVTVCHIGNISMRLGRPLKWDPVKEEFVGDATANAMLRRPMRAPWHL